eukprot:scaffold106438_cov22-Tisochrysis_lutea.AAC.1
MWHGCCVLRGVLASFSLVVARCIQEHVHISFSLPACYTTCCTHACMHACTSVADGLCMSSSSLHEGSSDGRCWTLHVHARSQMGFSMRQGGLQAYMRLGRGKSGIEQGQVAIWCQNDMQTIISAAKQGKRFLMSIRKKDQNSQPAY